jgi:radical SAM superfamily enzyme YgiQ (UPF0313 family)
MVHTVSPFSAPAILKSVVQQNNFKAKTIDFNLEFNTTLSDQNLQGFWQFGSTDTDTLVRAKKCVKKWAKQIFEHSPKWVGVSVFTYTCKIATEMLCREIKKQNSSIKIVLGGNGMGTGGINGSFDWSESLRKQNIIDAYIRSEAEESIIQLLKGNLSYNGINHNANHNQIKNLDQYNFPDYTDYDLENYRNRLPITGSRGCVRQCTFCDVHTHWKKFVYRSGENIFNEMKEQSQIHQIYEFNFTDSLINGSMKAYRDMIENLASHNVKADRPISWLGQFIARPSSQMTEEDWRLTKLAGAKYLSIGVETGSDKVRYDIKKKFTNKDLDFCVEMAYKYKVNIGFQMLLGYPTEYEKDFQDTMDMFTRYQKYKDIIEPHLGTTVAILPQTPLYEFAKSNHFKLGKTENDWWWHANPNLTLKERFRRRILLGKHVKDLGYELTGDKQEIQTILYIWTQYQKNLQVDQSKIHHSSSQEVHTQYYS